MAKLNAGFVHVVDATGGGEVGFGRGRHGGRWAEDIMIMDELMIDGVGVGCRMAGVGGRTADGRCEIFVDPKFPPKPDEGWTTLIISLSPRGCIDDEATKIAIAVD